MAFRRSGGLPVTGLAVSAPGRGARSRVATAGLLALALALVPFTPASAQRTTEGACPVDVDFEDPGFPDQGALSAGNEREIICIYNWGITTGRADGTFGTQVSVNRAQVVSFMIRLIGVAGVELGTEPAPDHTFTDTDAISAAHRDNVLTAAAVGLVHGFADGTFRPTAAVTRAQVATLLVRTQRLINVAYDLSGDDVDAYLDSLGFAVEFSDVAGNVHEDSILLLSRFGVVGGYPDGTYRPGAALTRGHMAALLARHLDVLDDLGLDDLGPVDPPVPWR